MGVGTVWHYPRGVAIILSQFRMIVHIKWRVYYSTDEQHRTRDIKNLGLEVITPQGLKCKFRPTYQGSHLHQVEKNNRGRIFGDIVNNINNSYVGSCHVIMQGQDNIVQIAEVPLENDATRMTENSNSDDNSQKKGNEVRFEDDAIDTTSKSRDSFSKRDQLKADQDIHLQNVAAFPTNITLLCSFSTNGVQNKLLTQRAKK